MEEEVIEKSSKASPILMAVGVLGFLFGLIAIALSLSSMVKVGDAGKELNDKIEKAAALALDMKKMSDKVDALSAQIEAIKGGDNSRVDNLANQMKNAVEKIGSILSENRKLIEENREAIEKVAKNRGARSNASNATSGAATAETAGAAPTESTAASESGDMIAYKIQSGDTIAKLAPKFNVSVSAILSANPNVNPSRLRVGQTINIPKK